MSRGPGEITIYIRTDGGAPCLDAIADPIAGRHRLDRRGS